MNFMKWGDLCGSAVSWILGPRGGPFWAPFGPPPLPGRATKIEKLFFIPGVHSILGRRKSYSV